MILVTGIATEPPLALVIEATQRENIDYTVFNQREAQYCDIALNNTEQSASGKIRIRECEYCLADINGIYPRMMDHQDLPESKSIQHDKHDDTNTKIAIFHELLTEWLEITPCRVMNRASDMGSNISKPYQAQIIKRCGLKTPITLISNDPESVRNFHKKFKRVIYKSISSVRSIVVELDAVKLLNLDKLKNLPTQFQVYVAGNDIRVHVVGDMLFATEIVSEAIDYRYASREDQDVVMNIIQLPIEIEAACYQLSKELNLPLCGIDLRKTPENNYYCFEVNPSPGYSYYQNTTGQNIAGAIVRYLEYGSAILHNSISNQSVYS